MALIPNPVTTILSKAINAIVPIDTLSPSSYLKREVSRATIGVVKKMGLPNVSGADVLRALRSEGYGIRSQDFYQQWRETQSTTFDTLEQPTTPRTPNIPDSMSGVGEYAPGFPGQRRAYVYEFQMEQWDYVEGKWRPKPFRFSSSKRMKPSTAFGEFYAKFEHLYDPSEVDWNSATYVKTYKR